MSAANPFEPDADPAPHADEAADAADAAVDTSRYDATTLEELRAAGAEARVWNLSHDSEQRLDKYLQNRLKGISRNQVEKLIKIGAVTLNGKPTKKSAALREGDVVSVWVPPKPAVDLIAEDIPLDILFEDEHMVVVNKRAGIIVHPARKYKSGTMVNALLHHLQKEGTADQLFDPGRDGDPHPDSARAKDPQAPLPDPRPGVVHRLDMNTTGVIVFAKQETSHGLISRQFEFRENLKCYLALVHGCPEPPVGLIDQPLGKHPTIREAHAVRHDDEGRESQTVYRVRRRYRGYSLVELELKTGRTHQIRVHLSHLGFPIVGDQLYGGEIVGDAERAAPPLAAGSRPLLNYARTKAEGLKLEHEGTRRAAAGELVMGTPALHAALLRIKHPVDERPLTFTAPLHPPMLDTVADLEARGVVGPPLTDAGTHVDLAAALPGIDLDAAPRPDASSDRGSGGPTTAPSAPAAPPSPRGWGRRGQERV